MVATASLAQKLRTYRETRGLSRGDFAAELGVEPVTIWRWEAGKRFVHRRLAPAVSEKTGIPTAELMGVS